MKSGLAAEHVVEVEDKYTDTVVAYGVKNKKSITEKHYHQKIFCKFIVLFLLGSSCREFF